jgi:hypothetical protein
VKVPLNNPASRLLNVFEKLRSQNLNQPAIHGWRAVLALGTSFEVLDHLGQVMKLPLRIQKAILDIPDINHEIFLRWTPQVEQGFLAHRLSGGLNEFLVPIDQNAVDRIEFCADRLSQTKPEKTLANEDIAKFKEQVGELQAELARTEIPQDLKVYISEHLIEIMIAINQYELVGITPLERALESTVGSAFLNRQRTDRVMETGIGKRFLKFIHWAAITVTLLHSAAQLPHDVSQLLVESDSVEVVKMHHNVPDGEIDVRPRVEPEKASDVPPVELARKN